MKIENIEIWNPDVPAYTGTIVIEDGRIASFDGEANEGDVIDGSGLIALPGFVDLHIHGACGSDVMDGTVEAFQHIARAVLQEGVTGFLCTTMTQSVEAIEQAIRDFASRTAQVPNILGIHLEGPFVNPVRAGAQPIQHIQAPNLALFQQWYELSGQAIRYVTIAPELVSDSFIEEVTKLGVVVSAGHTDATSEEIRYAQKKGVRSITHLYNQMRPFHHREIGAIGEALLNDALYCELIADFVHCSEEAAQFALKCKGEDRLILITDAMRAKSLEPGVYDLGGQDVFVKQDARLEDGTLAGSILKMNDALRNMSRFCQPQQLVKISSTNANQLLDRTGYGAIKEGFIADLVLIDASFNVHYTIINGQVVYQKR